MKTYTDPKTGKVIVDLWADTYPLPDEYYKDPKGWAKRLADKSHAANR